MKIKRKKNGTHRLTVSEDELRVIEKALLHRDNDEASGEARNYDVWDTVLQHMVEYGISQLEN